MELPPVELNNAHFDPEMVSLPPPHSVGYPHPSIDVGSSASPMSKTAVDEFAPFVGFED
jgi:hypothetical protein